MLHATKKLHPKVASSLQPSEGSLTPQPSGPRQGGSSIHWLQRHPQEGRSLQTRIRRPEGGLEPLPPPSASGPRCASWAHRRSRRPSTSPELLRSCPRGWGNHLLPRLSRRHPPLPPRGSPTERVHCQHSLASFWCGHLNLSASRSLCTGTEVEWSSMTENE